MPCNEPSLSNSIRRIRDFLRGSSRIFCLFHPQALVFPNFEGLQQKELAHALTYLRVSTFQRIFHSVYFFAGYEITESCIYRVGGMLFAVFFNGFCEDTCNEGAHLFRQGATQTGELGELYFAVDKGFAHSRNFFGLKSNAKRIAV